MDRYTRIYTGVQLVLLLGEVGGNRMIELNLENKKGKIKINKNNPYIGLNLACSRGAFIINYKLNSYSALNLT